MVAIAKDTVRAPFYSFPSAFRGKQHFSARRTDRQRQRDSARVVVVVARGRNCPRGFSYASALLLLLLPARDPFLAVRPSVRPSVSLLRLPSAPVNARALRFCRSGAAAAQSSVYRKKSAVHSEAETVMVAA